VTTSFCLSDPNLLQYAIRFTVITYKQCFSDTAATSYVDDSTAGSASYIGTTTDESETNTGQDAVTTDQTEITSQTSDVASGQIEITTEQFEPATDDVESTTNENVVTTGQNEVENNQSETVAGIIETSTIQMDVTASQPESSTDETVENAAEDSSTATPSKQCETSIGNETVFYHFIEINALIFLKQTQNSYLILIDDFL